MSSVTDRTLPLPAIATRRFGKPQWTPIRAVLIAAIAFAFLPLFARRVLAQCRAHSISGDVAGWHRTQPAYGLHRTGVARHRCVHGGRYLRDLQSSPSCARA